NAFSCAFVRENGYWLIKVCICVGLKCCALPLVASRFNLRNNWILSWNNKNSSYVNLLLACLSASLLAGACIVFKVALFVGSLYSFKYFSFNSFSTSFTYTFKSLSMSFFISLFFIFSLSYYIGWIFFVLSSCPFF